MTYVHRHIKLHACIVWKSTYKFMWFLWNENVHCLIL